MNIAEKLTTIAENEQLVVNANAELEEALYSNSEGGKSHYDIFWNAYQDNGNRTNYHQAFAGKGWNDVIFKPKYDLSPTDARSMFYSSEIVDLVGILKKQNTRLDFSNCTQFGHIAQFAAISEFGIIDTTSCDTLATTLLGENYSVKTIEKVVLREDGSQNVNGCFWGAFWLQNIVIEGTIGTTTAFAQSSALTKASIASIVNALSDTATEQTLTFHRSAVNNAFETSSGAADGSTSAEFAALIATKSNWTISLV